MRPKKIAFKNRILGFLSKNDQRTKRIVENVFFSFSIKAGSIMVSLFLVPLTINYINPLQYGIWITISSIITWMSFFDIGLGNGLRNKLAQCLAINDFENGKKYVSTTYAILTILSAFIFILFLIINQFIDWRGILNIPNSVNDNIQTIMLIVICSFCVQFVLQILNIVLIASHQSAKSGFVTFMGQLFVVFFIYIFKRTTVGTLSLLVKISIFSPIIVLLLCSIYFYTKKLKQISPSIKAINFRYTKDILNSGTIFFILQLGAILLFQTDNIIISKVIGPSEVTNFNVSYRLFSVVTMIFTILITPYWSAFTEAYAKNDFIWMRKEVKKIRKIWVLSSFIFVPFLYLVSDFLFKIWVGKSVNISHGLSFSMSLYVIGHTCLFLNCYFLNGVGKIKLQFYLYIFSTLINIPLGVFLGKSYGLIGVVFSNIIIFVYMNVFLWIQANYILKGITANSRFKIWYK